MDQFVDQTLDLAVKARPIRLLHDRTDQHTVGIFKQAV